MINTTLPTQNINDLEQLKFKTDSNGNVVVRTAFGSGQIAKNSATAFIHKMILNYDIDYVTTEIIGSEEIIRMYYQDIIVARFVVIESDTGAEFSLSILTSFMLGTQNGDNLITQSDEYMVTQ
jgi:hypothetical protein